MKFDFYPVKVLSITSDQKNLLFGANRKIHYLDFENVLRSKDKIKMTKMSSITRKLANPDSLAIEGNNKRANIVASLSD